MKSMITFSAGILFALGLGISGMTQPHIVRGFLDVFGNWDPRLLGVMGGAIAVHAIAFRLIIKRNSPILEMKFQLPSKKDIDLRLIWGSVIFGLGWGWTGICPGPGLVSSVTGDVRILLFIVALFTGMLSFQFIERKVLK